MAAEEVGVERGAVLGFEGCCAYIQVKGEVDGLDFLTKDHADEPMIHLYLELNNIFYNIFTVWDQC